MPDRFLYGKDRHYNTRFIRSISIHRDGAIYADMGEDSVELHRSTLDFDRLNLILIPGTGWARIYSWKLLEKFGEEDVNLTDITYTRTQIVGWYVDPNVDPDDFGPLPLTIQPSWGGIVIIEDGNCFECPSDMVTFESEEQLNRALLEKAREALRKRNTP